MIEYLASIDTTLFYFINNSLQNAFFDWLMPAVTNKYNWFPLFAVIYVLLWWKGGKQGRTAALLIIPVIVLSDQISSAMIKPMVQRLRPCVALEHVNMLIGLKTSYSFPSSHAANSMATATFFAYFYPKGKWLYFVLAGLVGISRVYVGVHYPFDVVAGAALGVASALSVIYLYQLVSSLYTRRKP